MSGWNGSSDTATFAIHGWASDGKPLIRCGVGWLQFSNLGRKDRAAIYALEVGQSVDAMFKTIAGRIVYRVERTA